MIGTMLGNRYELLEKIGEGGMAVVYKAKCHLLNRYVAVKILKDNSSGDKEFVSKFKREATAAASLSDNNIVNIYDVGTQDDINYIVMEYINGKTLKQIIREDGKMATPKVINTAIQIAKALDCAHKNNIIHRDIKPHNILVTEDGLVKVTDFGIAKASNSVTITNSSKVMGSAHYFSPEQAKGSYVDCRTDIYSLGIVIYEMVAGRVPYDAESAVSVALKHIQEPVVPPKELNEKIPESLNKLILKSVEKEPIKRYQTIKDMLVDLRKIENNQEFNIPTNDFDEDMTRAMDPIVIDEKNNNYKKYDDDDDDEFSEDTGRGLDSKKKKTLMIIAVAVLVVAIGAISGYFAYSKISDVTAKEIAVPSIVGMKQEDAKKSVEEKKLKFVAIKEKSDRPEGTVLKTNPPAGTKVKINSDVRVSVSGGKEKLGVPNLIGVDIGSAKDIISSSGLTLGTVSSRFSDNVAKDCVISQDPEADSSAGTDTKINLVVSKGQEIRTVTVPEVNGKNIDEAANIIINAGLKVSKSAVPTNDKTQDGKVISQSVSSGEQIRQGYTINLTYYKYKEPEQKHEEASSKKPDDSNQEPEKGQGTVSTGSTGTGSTGGQQTGEQNNKPISNENKNKN